MSTSKKTNSTSISYGLKVAAGASQLDNIKITHIDYRIAARKTIFILKYGNWQDRVINRSIATINEDIRVTLIKYKNPELHIWKLVDVIENPLYVTVNMHYKFR